MEPKATALRRRTGGVQAGLVKAGELPAKDDIQAVMLNHSESERALR
ncbi:MAG: hypothetical protein MUF54_08155 [Polyangiaceae bacterium]|nr:hypothetical protein [Polyangiaceae bacterium]